MSTRKFRIILLLLLMTGFVSTINAQEQKISLSLNNATLKQFFNEIELIAKEYWTTGRI